MKKREERAGREKKSSSRDGNNFRREKEEKEENEGKVKERERERKKRRGEISPLLLRTHARVRERGEGKRREGEEK